MATQTIEIVRNAGYTETYNLATLPTSPGPKSVVFAMHDTVAVSRSPFTGLTQTQIWPGADYWEVQIALPPMPRSEAAPWIAFFMSLRGQANVFQIGDPGGVSPQGTPIGAPVVNGANPSTNNLPGATTLYTRGWQENAFRLLLPGDYLQIGYRLYTCLDTVNSDASGDASFTIWPSLREQPADGTTITFANTTGLFRLSDNARQWTNDYNRLLTMTLQATEAI